MTFCRRVAVLRAAVLASLYTAQLTMDPIFQSSNISSTIYAALRYVPAFASLVWETNRKLPPAMVLVRASRAETLIVTKAVTNPSH